MTDKLEEYLHILHALPARIIVVSDRLYEGPKRRLDFIEIVRETPEAVMGYCGDQTLVFLLEQEDPKILEVIFSYQSQTRVIIGHLRNWLVDNEPKGL